MMKVLLLMMMTVWLHTAAKTNLYLILSVDCMWYVLKNTKFYDRLKLEQRKSPPGNYKKTISCSFNIVLYSCEYTDILLTWNSIQWLFLFVFPIFTTLSVVLWWTLRT